MLLDYSSLSLASLYSILGFHPVQPSDWWQLIGASGLIFVGMLQVGALFKGMAFHVKQDPCSLKCENFKFSQDVEWTPCDAPLGSTWNARAQSIRMTLEVFKQRRVPVFRSGWRFHVEHECGEKGIAIVPRGTIRARFAAHLPFHVKQVAS